MIRATGQEPSVSQAAPKDMSVRHGFPGREWDFKVCLVMSVHSVYDALKTVNVVIVAAMCAVVNFISRECRNHIKAGQP